MIPTSSIFNSSLISQVCSASFTGLGQSGGASWTGSSMVGRSGGIGEMACISERIEAYLPVEKLRPETNHKDNQGGAHSV